MIDLKGKRALVTGGSRGIGRATALLLADCGADVCIGFRSAAAEAAEVVAELRGRGVRGEAVAADLGTRAGADHLFDETLQRLGGLDIYVGNAGIWPASDVPLGDMDDTRWRTTMSANLDAIFWTTRRAVLVTSTRRSAGRRSTPTTPRPRAPWCRSSSRWPWSWGRATSR